MLDQDSLAGLRRPSNRDNYVWCLDRALKLALQPLPISRDVGVLRKVVRREHVRREQLQGKGLPPKWHVARRVAERRWNGMVQRR